MSIDLDPLYSIETIESIIADPESSWKTRFKETIFSMIASNQNELLWYANFLSRCEYEFHQDESFVSSVYFNGKNFVIAINPIILGVIEKNQMIAILKHSAGHIIHHHFRRSHQDNTHHKEIIEMAKDIVINGNRDLPYIQDLPKTGKYNNSPIQALFYQSLSEKYGVEHYEVGRAFEYYVGLILAAKENDAPENAEENTPSSLDGLEEDANEETEVPLPSPMQSSGKSASPQNTQSQNDTTPTSFDALHSDDISHQPPQESTADAPPRSLSEKTLEALENGTCHMDNHTYGAQRQEAVGLEKHLMDTFMDATLKEMIDEATHFARGFTPSDALETRNAIEKRQSHKDWKKILHKKMRNYLTNSMRHREPNKSRQHPIYQDDVDLYGYSPGKKPKLGVVLDVSGSVDDRLLSALMSEVQAIQKKYAIKYVTLVQVDAEIKSIEKFSVYDKCILRHGGGGTLMEPGFNALLKQSSREIPDLIICATDGDIEERFEHLTLPSKVQVIWLISKTGRLLFDTSVYPKQQMHVIAFSV